MAPANNGFMMLYGGSERVSVGGGAGGVGGEALNGEANDAA